MLGLLFPAICLANSYLPLQASPALPPLGQFLHSQSQEAPSQPSPHSVTITLSSCVSGATPLAPEYKLGSLCPSSPPHPHPLSLGAQKTTGEKAREPAALSPLKRRDLPPQPRSPYLPETMPRPGGGGLTPWSRQQLAGATEYFY